jgi:hypothetical protein
LIKNTKLIGIVRGGVVDEDEWSGSRLGRFISREIVPGAHWLGSWVGCRTGLDAVEIYLYTMLLL